jgi:hypothetical protein
MIRPGGYDTSIQQERHLPGRRIGQDVERDMGFFGAAGF